MKKVYIVLIAVILILIIIAIIAGIFAIRNSILVKALMLAVKNDDITGAEKIIDKHFNLNMPERSVLHCYLTESHSCTPLQEACGDGSLNMVKLLVDNGADVNYVKPFSAPVSPLMCAMKNRTDDQLEIIEYLLKNGADTKYSVNKRNDVFHSLIEHNRDITNKVEILKLLEEYGEDLQRIDISGNSILNIACYWKENEIILYLLGNDNIDVNHTDNAGYTPLIEYCDGKTNFDVTIVEALISHGADITLKNEDGKTALDYAIESGNTEAFELLQN